MKILLIEDEQAHREKYKACVNYLPYTVDLSIANGCKHGIELTRQVCPDIVLLDLELHESDGDGILFLNELKELKLSSTPYIIVITSNTSRRVHRIARKCGADYIFTKTKPDYSPRLLFDFSYNYFVNQADETTCNGSASEKENPLEFKIADEIEKVGITSGISGRSYIIEAVLIILNLYSNKLKPGNINLNAHVYPVIARKYKESDKTVEQGIRNAIKRAWLITDLDSLVENYTAQVSYRTGFPENRDFIFYYANRLEKDFFGA